MAFFAFLSPVVGWIGVAVTGSDTSANSLFGLLQTTAATETGISPYLLAAANTSGGVLGKMISPQNLAIAAAVVGIEGKESALFRKVICWSLGLLVGMCVLVYLQSTPGSRLDGRRPDDAASGGDDAGTGSHCIDRTAGARCRTAADQHDTAGDPAGAARSRLARRRRRSRAGPEPGHRPAGARP